MLPLPLLPVKVRWRGFTRTGGVLRLMVDRASCHRPEADQRRPPTSARTQQARSGRTEEDRMDEIKIFVSFSLMKFTMSQARRKTARSRQARSLGTEQRAIIRRWAKSSRSSQTLGWSLANVMYIKYRYHSSNSLPCLLLMAPDRSNVRSRRNAVSTHSKQASDVILCRWPFYSALKDSGWSEVKGDL